MTEAKISAGPSAYVTAMHDEEWTGTVHVQWRMGDAKGSFTVPGKVARMLFEGADWTRYTKLRAAIESALESDAAP